MAKVEITATQASHGASAQLEAKARAAASVTDALGRVITLKRPGPLAQFRLVEAVGDSASNKVYMGMVLPLIFVTAIDGEDVITPGTKDEVEFLIKQLDEAGIEAVMQGVADNFSSARAGDEKNA